MLDTHGKFYLGRLYNPNLGETTHDPLLYDPDDLNTHAFVVGMTGSGKTGLCIDLLEEAALQGIPALMIDPKGDITNALLHFPDLSPDDFQPWVNADQARREGKSVEQAAQEAAALWTKGLAQWNIGAERLQALRNAAEFTVYTPGSDAGIPVSIMASLKAPPIPWEQNREILREKINSTVTALLGLVGMTDIDPVRSREHILLANIFETAWSQSLDLDLGELIMQVQNPPFQKLGVFEVDVFFPEQERFELAMLLNNILAAPAFHVWLEGQPLDISTLLYTSDGRPRHSVFTISHLNDQERMFFVTLLFNAVETWMRTQSGTTSLRAVLYFDEIFGYLPAGMRNPPSKVPMLRMLKQARAFGVGLVLVTQNPVDVDYKALSNTGTWFIGKLQTEQDKERLLDGLEGASAGGLDRGEFSDLIARLGKRVFLLHNVHERHPVLFQTRWAMNYLAGPLTRSQIPTLNQLAGGARKTFSLSEGVASVEPPSAAQPVGAGEEPSTSLEAQEDALEGSLTRPKVPARVDEYFLPHNLTLSQASKLAGATLPADAEKLGVLYRPVLLAHAVVRFTSRKYDLTTELQRTAIVPEPDRSRLVRWGEYLSELIEDRALESSPLPNARFASLEAPLSDSSAVSSLKNDFEEWLYRNLEVRVRANEALDVFAGPEVSKAEFRAMCAEAARRDRDEEIEKAQVSYDRKLKRLQDRLEDEVRELAEDEAELEHRKREELGTHAENLLSFLTKGRRRRLSTSLSKRRMTEKARADVDESIAEIKKYERELTELEQEKADALKDIKQRWSETAERMTEIAVHPYKKDIMVPIFGVAWFPHLIVGAGGRTFELPGFGFE